MINYILIALIAFASGVIFTRLLTSKRPPPFETTMEYVRLRRFAIRLSYLFGEGTLSKNVGTVRFEFGDDGLAATECFEAISGIIQIGSSK